MDPNQIPEPTDSLTKPTFTPPEAWQSDQNPISVSPTPDPLFPSQPTNPEPISPQPTAEIFPTPPLPATEIPSSSKKFNVFLRFSLAGLALILLGILIGVLAARFLPMSTNQEIPTPTPTLTLTATPTLDPTANWKTHINEKFGFSFRYPQNAMLTDAENKIYLISDELTNFTPGDNTAKIYIFLNSKALGGADQGVEPDSIIQKIDNIDAKRYSTTREMDPSEKLDIVTFSRNGVYYNIELSWYKNDKSNIQIFDQILSTFKFIEPTPSVKLVCPTTEWVDCMPSPDMIKPQCDATFLTWATANCPGFKGAAL